MKRNLNPYIARYKKLHREKVRRKTTIYRLPKTFEKITRAFEALAETARRNGLSLQYMSCWLGEFKHRITDVYDDCIKEG